MSPFPYGTNSPGCVSGTDWASAARCAPDAMGSLRMLRMTGCRQAARAKSRAQEAREDERVAQSQRALRSSHRAGRPGPRVAGSASASCWSCARGAAPGVAAWRRARKVMNTSVAPTPKAVSIGRRPAAPSVPAGAGRRAASRRRRWRGRAPASARGRCRLASRWPSVLAMNRADTERDVAEPDVAGRQAEFPGGKQDLHHERRVVAHLPAADDAGHGHQQPVARHEGQARAQRLVKALGGRHAAPRSAGVPGGSARRGSAARRRPPAPKGALVRLIRTPAAPGPATSAVELARAVPGMGLHQPLPGHDLGQHDLRRAAGHGVDGADGEADHVQPGHGQPAQPPGQRYAGHGDGQQGLAGDVDRQLVHPVQPDAQRAATAARRR